jgi:hypothetical protein
LEYTLRPSGKFFTARWGCHARSIEGANGSMKKYFVFLALVSVAMMTGRSPVSAGLVNGGFETGDLTGWNSLGAVTVATGFDYGSAGTVSAFEGTFAARLSSGSGIAASDIAGAMGVDEATLEASNGGLDATQGSLVFQSVDAVAGDVLGFRWNFVEQDYLPFDDWAFYGVKFNNDPTSVVKFASLATVGPGGGSTIAGWQSLNYTITQSGNYTFYFGIVDALDVALPSELWIDGIRSGNPTVPEPTSIAVFGLLGLAGAVRARQKMRQRTSR